ncbi:MFS transporter [Haladaptatus caseinilyticus]|uniref:MFS transporter n=1 Tax=Haladaptatus caseinilyticus TaxID=2993314 RepID=UPI00224A7933|nr:MFS transporter [Haladaptatus caseinilyticus]
MTEKGSSRALATVFTIVFVDLLGFGILIPVIPLYASAFGANEFVVGLLIASYSIMQFVFAPVLGRLSDVRGRRPILLLSLFGSVLAWTLFGLAESLVVLFLARLLAGAMGGNIATAQAYIADITPPEERAKGLGLIGAAFGLGFVFGPALGGLVSSDAAITFIRGFSPGFVPINRFSLPSFLAAGICAVNLAVAFFTLPETRTERTTEGGDESRIARLFDSLSDPALSGLVVSFFLVSLALSGMESMFVLFTEQKFGYGTTMNGYVLAYVGIIIAIVQGGLIGRLTDRFGERTIALVGASLEFVTLSALPFSPVIGRLLPTVGPFSDGLLALSLVLTPLAVGNGFTNVSLTTLVSKSASDDEQGGAFGITQSAGSIARAIGPIAAGGLYAAVAYWVPFVLGGLLMLPICYVILTTVQVGKRSTPAENAEL